MNPNTAVRDEYECQLLEFSCSELFDQVKSTIFEEIDLLLDKCSQSLCAKAPIEEKHAVEKGTALLCDCYKRAVEEPLQKLAEGLPNYFSVPSHVLLPEDAVHRKHYSIEDERKFEDDVHQLAMMLKRAHVMKQLLQAESHQTSILLKKFELLSSFGEHLKALENLDQLDPADSSNGLIEDISTLETESINHEAFPPASSDVCKFGRENCFIKLYVQKDPPN